MGSNHSWWNYAWFSLPCCDFGNSSGVQAPLRSRNCALISWNLRLSSGLRLSVPKPLRLQLNCRWLSEASNKSSQPNHWESVVCEIHKCGLSGEQSSYWSQLLRAWMDSFPVSRECLCLLQLWAGPLEFLSWFYQAERRSLPAVTEHSWIQVLCSTRYSVGLHCWSCATNFLRFAEERRVHFVLS